MISCFNEAAVFQPRKLDMVVKRLWKKFRFNEAAVFQPRKHAVRAKESVGIRASMRPRSFNRGNELEFLSKYPHILAASMRPRSFNRGNELKRAKIRGRTVLQ